MLINVKNRKTPLQIRCNDTLLALDTKQNPAAGIAVEIVDWNGEPGPYPIGSGFGNGSEPPP